MNYGDVTIRSVSKYLKIESGQPHDLRLLSSEPVEVLEHFNEGGMPVKCLGEDDCQHCAEGEMPQQKFLANVYDHGIKRVLLWKYGASIAKQIKSIANTLAEENKTVLEVDLKVDATGSNKTKRYTVTPRLTSKPVPEGLVLHKIDEDIPF